MITLFGLLVAGSVQIGPQTHQLDLIDPITHEIQRVYVQVKAKPALKFDKNFWSLFFNKNYKLIPPRGSIYSYQSRIRRVNN